MNIRWTRRPDGSLAAETMIAGVRVAGVVTPAELAAEQDAIQAIGFKITFKGLARGLKSIASPTAVLKLAQNASSVIDKIPGVKAALIASGPLGMSVMGGLAAAKALSRAKQGDPRAQAIVQRAEQIAQLPAAQRAALPMPTTRDGHIIRWIVALQRLE